jgi:CheY-like chemotaxis protein
LVISPNLDKGINMVKDLFSKWKKEEAITEYEDDHQQAEGKVILERMTSIIATDEAYKKDSRVDAGEAPDTSLSNSPIVIEKFEIRVHKPAMGFKTPEDNIPTVQNPGYQTIPPKIEGGISPDENGLINIKPQDRSGPHKKEARLEESITSPSEGITKKKSPLILVVEDEPVTQRLIKKILEDRGYGVVVACDGIDALMELGKRDFDLILSDLSMPNLDGFKLLDFINMKNVKASIIFLTGSDDVEDEIKVLALGAKDYIRKPINRDLLLLRVSKVFS